MSQPIYVLTWIISDNLIPDTRAVSNDLEILKKLAHDSLQFDGLSPTKLDWYQSRRMLPGTVDIVDCHTGSVDYGNAFPKSHVFTITQAHFLT